MANNKRANQGSSSSTGAAGLPSWREVITPHRDVAKGTYKKAEFAADLTQVVSGKGGFEYCNPVGFFARTYVTEGMIGLLKQALLRVSDQGGEPVIQLKTAFGGGKTHSMLALYHMMRGEVSLDEIPNVKPVLDQAGLASLPKVNVAVIVGSALDPSKSERPNNMPGITINTLWGKMAAQLAESAGNSKLYDYVKEADQKSVSPGSETLKNLFDAAGPCLILMDELVAYARKLYGAKGLPAGTFENFTTFIQEVTEAAKASRNSVVVVSIPESDIEIDGEASKKVLETIEKIIGRVESIWKPVAASEGFEVVRRRLFQDCENPDARDLVCSEFSQMYYKNQRDFPPEVREVEYLNKMVSCYPIHPEVFDRLYEDWATSEKFQRTRGVLRLMAAVIHALWMGNDHSLMIMPGSIPLNVPNVRDELTGPLPQTWNGVVDSEVDGKNSTPYKQDQANDRFGKIQAAQRIARTIMLGSAPTSRGQNVRGIESPRIRLGVVQPGESIAIFNDALGALTSELKYLYTNPSKHRYWYDTIPTLLKTAQERATQIKDSDVEYEIKERLHNLRKGGPFMGIHICPSSSLDVPDDQTARLVVLSPPDEYNNAEDNTSASENPAMTQVTEILNHRGPSNRSYRNMLAFIAPDRDVMTDLNETVRMYLAWKSIKEGSAELNLDAAQNKETENNLNRINSTVDAQITEAYCWLLAPYIDKADIATIVWNKIPINGRSSSIIAKAGENMIRNELIITEWAPNVLLLELDNLLWEDKDSIAVKELWRALCSYCYLPRLANDAVLIGAIRKGLNSDQYFAYASGYDGTRYLDLTFNPDGDTVNLSGYLVKVSVAQKQMAEDAAKRQAETGSAVNDASTSVAASIIDGESNTTQPLTSSDDATGTPAAPQYSRFFMSAPLDNTRINRDVQIYIDEIIKPLISADGTQVNVSLEVNAETAKGFTPETVRAVSGNCRDLHVREHGFVE